MLDGLHRRDTLASGASVLSSLAWPDAEAAMCAENPAVTLAKGNTKACTAYFATPGDGDRRTHAAQALAWFKQVNATRDAGVPEGW